MTRFSTTARAVARATAAAGLAVIAMSAAAQMRSAPENYVGLSIGQSSFGAPCVSGFACDRKDTGYKFTLGRQTSANLGGELSLIEFGQMQRGGGNTKAQGANLSLVGRLPLGADFGAFAKVGATYSRSTTDASNLSGLATGRASGWGASYGAGLSYDLTPHWTMLAEWERHRVRFAGDSGNDVDSARLGVNFRY